MRCEKCNITKLSDEMLTVWKNPNDSFPYHPLMCKHPISICLKCAAYSTKCFSCDKAYSKEERNQIIRKYCRVTGEEFYDEHSRPLLTGEKIIFTVSESVIPDCVIVYDDGTQICPKSQFVRDGETSVYRRIEIELKDNMNYVFFLVKTAKQRSLKDLVYTIVDENHYAFCVIDVSISEYFSSLVIGSLVRQERNFYPRTISEFSSQQDPKQLLSQYMYTINKEI